LLSGILLRGQEEQNGSTTADRIRVFGDHGRMDGTILRVSVSDIAFKCIEAIWMKDKEREYVRK